MSETYDTTEEIQAFFSGARHTLKIFAWDKDGVIVVGKGCLSYDDALAEVNRLEREAEQKLKDAPCSRCNNSGWETVPWKGNSSIKVECSHCLSNWINSVAAEKKKEGDE